LIGTEDRFEQAEAPSNVRTRRRLVAIAMVVVVLAGVVTMLVVHAARSAGLGWRERLIRLRDAGEPISLAGFPVPARTGSVVAYAAFEPHSNGRPSEENAFSPRAAARRLALPEAHFGEPSEACADLLRAGRTTPEREALLRRWRVEVAEALEDVEVAARSERWDRPPMPSGLRVGRRDEFESATLAIDANRLLAAGAVLDARDGELHAAVRQLETALRLSELVAQDPAMLSLCIAFVAESPVLGAVERVRELAPDADLRPLERWIDPAASRRRALRALRFERAWLLESARVTRDEQIVGFPDYGNLPGRAFGMVLGDRDLAQMLAVFERFTALLRSDDPAALAAAPSSADLESELVWFSSFGSLAVAGCTRLAKLEADHEAKERRVRALLAPGSER